MVGTRWRRGRKSDQSWHTGLCQRAKFKLCHRNIGGGSEGLVDNG